MQWPSLDSFRFVPSVGVIVAALAVLTLWPPRAVLAQTEPEPTAISIGAPTTAELGQRVTLQARLVDSSGAPLAKAAVLFTSPSSFLNVSGAVVIARATTNADGLAITTHEVRRTGALTIQAEFQGSDRYAPTRVNAQMTVPEAPRQLYIPPAETHLSDFDPADALAWVLPGGTPTSLVMFTPWPSLNGWPIGAALAVVWCLYVFVVALIFRVAAAGADREAAPLRTRAERGSSVGWDFEKTWPPGHVEP